jgi:ribokinase
VSRVVVLGDVMVDVVARLEGPIAPESDAPARIEYHGGGSGANVAAWLAAAGASPVLAGRVGDDGAGREALGALRAGGVDARLTADPSEATGTCVVLVAPGGERTMVPDPGANDRLQPGDLPDELLSPGGHLHIAGYVVLRAGSRAAAVSGIARARERGMSISVDPSSAALLSSTFLDLVAGADLLVPNRAEAAALTGLENPEAAAKQLALASPEVVVTLGADGALWTDGREVVRVPAAQVPGAIDGAGSDPGARPVQAAIDTTGAGDAFTAGLLAARMDGAEPEAAMAAGCRLAAEAVATSGARPLARGLGRRRPGP